MIDELADLFLLDLLECFVVVKIGKTEVEHIIVERSRPGAIRRICDGVTENFVRYKKNSVEIVGIFA